MKTLEKCSLRNNMQNNMQNVNCDLFCSMLYFQSLKVVK